MSDISVSWIAVSRSAWRIRLRWVALMLTSGVGAAVPVMLWFGSESAAAIAAIAAMGIATLMGRKFVTAQASGSWCVRPDGTVSIRWDGAGGVSDKAAAAFVSSFLIVLRDGRRKLEVWRDATPTSAFRRLAVSIRWNVARAPFAVFS